MEYWEACRHGNLSLWCEYDCQPGCCLEPAIQLTSHPISLMTHLTFKIWLSLLSDVQEYRISIWWDACNLNEGFASKSFVQNYAAILVKIIGSKSVKRYKWRAFSFRRARGSNSINSICARGALGFFLKLRCLWLYFDSVNYWMIRRAARVLLKMLSARVWSFNAGSAGRARATIWYSYVVARVWCYCTDARVSNVSCALNWTSLVLLML